MTLLSAEAYVFMGQFNEETLVIQQKISSECDKC